MIKNKQKLILMVILLITLTIRLIFVYTTPQGALPKERDGVGYHLTAVRLLETGKFAYGGYGELKPNAYVTPGYPLFLAGMYSIFGANANGLKAVAYTQAVLSVATLFLMFLLAQRLLGYKAGILAIILAAIYPPFTWANSYILTEVVFTFFLMCFVFLMVLGLREKKAWIFFLSGLALGVASIIRPTPAPYIAVVFVLIFANNRPIKPKLFVSAAVLIVGFLLIMSPWWLRNFELYHRFVPLSTEGGNPFLTGVHPRVQGYLETFNSLPSAADEFQQNQLWYQKGKEIILQQLKSNPIGYVRWFTVEKLALLWGPIWNEGKPIKESLITPWSMLHLPIVLLGWLFVLKEILAKRNFEITLLVLFYSFIHMVYLPLPRYGFPLMPLMIVCAAVFIANLHTVKHTIKNEH